MHYLIRIKIRHRLPYSIPASAIHIRRLRIILLTRAFECRYLVQLIKKAGYELVHLVVELPLEPLIIRQFMYPYPKSQIRQIVILFLV